MKIDQATVAGVVFGIGLGGAVDGFLFRMILRWHHMVSNIIPPNTAAGVHTNLLWDGLFHAFSWIVALVGILMLWNVAKYQAERARRLPSTKTFVGSLTLGYGLFNLIEGIINHHLLALHNVREVSNPLPWNIGFLLIGGGLVIMIGLALMRRGDRRRLYSCERRLA